MRGQRLPGRVVVVTGASSGIGKAAAAAFAAEGAAVVASARRADALEDTVAKCSRHGIPAVAVVADTADPDDVDRLAHLAIAEFGHFDVWINNASALLLGSLEQTPREAYRRLVDVNLLGYVYGARAALHHFRERGRGVLINNASLASLTPAGYTNAYTATKHAVAGLTEALRQELVPARGIHAVTILPAGVDTPILDHAANYTGRRVRALYPLVPPEKVAKAMVRAASRPKRAIVVGRTGRIHATLYRLAPATAEQIYGTLAVRALRHADRVPITDGNLFEPVAAGTSVEGGLRARSRTRRLIAPGLAGVGLAVLARALGERRR